MTKETIVTSERDTAIRALLVDTVDRPARRRRRSMAIIATVAFLLGGGVTAGALSATAATRDAPTSGEGTAQDMFSMFLHGGRTVGPVLTHAGTGSSTIDLGPRPADATGIAVYLQCEGSGAFVQTLGGEARLAQHCAIGTGMGFSSEKNPTGTVVSTKADSTLAYSLWAQWIHVPAPSAPSVAQDAATADGVITEAEYRAAIDRFSACMTGAGYPLTGVEYLPDFTYGTATEAAENGTVDRCQDAELSQVMKLWQQQQG
jgi:hypothetical protein